jgi:hypothetical protein
MQRLVRGDAEGGEVEAAQLVGDHRRLPEGRPDAGVLGRRPDHDLGDAVVGGLPVGGQLWRPRGPVEVRERGQQAGTDVGAVPGDGAELAVLAPQVLQVLAEGIEVPDVGHDPAQRV